MTTLEAQALRLLTDLGFEEIKITGRSGDEILYSHTDGEPVMDAPVARVVGDRVQLLPWTVRLDG